MPIKITVTGKPVAIRQAVYQNNTVVCLDFEEGGSVNPPKGLPQASTLTTTVLMNQKQWNKLLKSVKEAGETIKTAHKFLIQGEINVDLPMDIVEGDMGITAFQAQYLPQAEKSKDEKPSLEEKKVEKSNNSKEITIKNKSFVVLEEIDLSLQNIKIPETFLSRSPKPEKVQNNIKYYKRNGKFNGEVVVIKEESDWLLIDGYAKYVAAKEMNLSTLNVAHIDDGNPTTTKELVGVL
ncbi:hypothetical protein [Bacillus cereus group sp. TH152-1LC]|uniref:hypothetical protein n=1 Tax=Bacillus cereus group sp. TH152-1LC TaxID=3018060 RepID=UPI0022E79D73|nr:hypothetical protein [Bacillus cereus group sp. TH152-1LC]MDA1675575.1 hypothetical protein [Bacillus cereus group sp. TH152-1LC]